MTTRTDRNPHRFVYDHRGDIVTLADVAWGDSSADEEAAARRYAALRAARARGEYVPSFAACAATWSLDVALAERGIRGRVLAVNEEPIEGRRDAVDARFVVEVHRSAQRAAVDALTADGAPRETRVVNGVLYVRTIAVDPWPGASEGRIEEPPY